jgi:hypothetical protein
MYSEETRLRMMAQELQARFERALSNNKTAANSGGYGLTAKQVRERLLKQNVNCAICQMSLEDRRWDIDHCHVAGPARGLLCHKCNSWLGQYEAMVEAVWAYLRQYV